MQTWIKVAGLISAALVVSLVYLDVGETPGETAPAPASAPQAQTSRPVKSKAELRALVEKFRTQWHAEDGSAADELLQKAARYAHIYRRGGWSADDDGKDVTISTSFVDRKSKTDDEGYTIFWTVEPDGTAPVGPNGFKAAELGWLPFALELVQSQLDDGIPPISKSFLLESKNLSYINTDAGPLSELLAHLGCRPDAALHAANWDESAQVWMFDTSVKCRASAVTPEYCAGGGPLMFTRTKAQGSTWTPASGCARLIVGQ